VRVCVVVDAVCARARVCVYVCVYVCVCSRGCSKPTATNRHPQLESGTLPQIRDGWSEHLHCTRPRCGDCHTAEKCDACSLEPVELLAKQKPLPGGGDQPSQPGDERLAFFQELLLLINYDVPPRYLFVM
jgi:hypothetical protein